MKQLLTLALDAGVQSNPHTTCFFALFLEVVEIFRLAFCLTDFSFAGVLVTSDTAVVLSVVGSVDAKIIDVGVSVLLFIDDGGFLQTR